MLLLEIDKTASWGGGAVGWWKGKAKLQINLWGSLRALKLVPTTAPARTGVLHTFRLGGGGEGGIKAAWFAYKSL